jgi:hypothetical protein
MIRGLRLATKMYAENVSWLRIIFGTTEDTVANVIMVLVCVGTILLSAFMAVVVMTFYVLMKLGAVIALIFLAFILFEATRFTAAPGLARLLAYGVQALALSLVTGMMFSTLDALNLTGRLQADHAITVMVVVMFFAFLLWNCTTIAKEQISGMPILSLNEPAIVLGRGAMGAASMLPGVGKAGLGALGGMPEMPGWRGPSTGWSGSAPGIGGAPGGTGAAGASAAKPAGIGSAPASVRRLLARSNTIDGTWTDAKDLPPKAVQRLLAQGQRRLPGGSPPSLPPPPRTLPPPRS